MQGSTSAVNVRIDALAPWLLEACTTARRSLLLVAVDAKRWLDDYLMGLVVGLNRGCFDGSEEACRQGRRLLALR
jgi:hypothetical protein